LILKSRSFISFFIGTEMFVLVLIDLAQNECYKHLPINVILSSNILEFFMNFKKECVRETYFSGPFRSPLFLHPRYLSIVLVQVFKSLS